ncbi:MAG: methyltransferase domain-containing protein [Alphaproteobacteria bacterium]|nr:methyltransferase domain-containing protein [Alphaproteobacteria bacterium]
MRLILLCFALLLFACDAQSQSTAQGSDDVYTYGQANRDGIGKVYMGREISHVMGHLGAGWLERPERQRDERTDLLIVNLDLEPDHVVADIGAGTGFFTFPVSGRVPQGKVLAVDIQPEMLSIIEQRKAAGSKPTSWQNIETILGTEDNPNLPESAVDLIFMVDAYHEFAYPREMGEAMARALKPGGRIALIEYRAEDRRVPIKRLHKMTEAQSRKEMEALGLTWIETKDVLPQQHLMIFAKPAE